MKTSIIAVLLCAACTTFGQNACQTLFNEGREFYRQAEYRKALLKFNSARACDGSRSSAIDKEVEKIFAAIEKQRLAEIAERERAEAAERTAKAQQSETQIAKFRADSLLAEQQQAFILLARETALAEAYEQQSKDLAERGEQLLSDISRTDRDVFEVLTRQAQAYLSQTNTGAHDYGKARIYFSLARFVRSEAMLDTLIQGTQIGQIADSLFFAGAIIKAEKRYLDAAKRLESGAVSTNYEMQQVQRINQMLQQQEDHRVFNNYTSGNRLVLKGDWWVVPQEMLASTQLTTIVIIGNTQMENNLPFDLAGYPGIDTIIIENCPNFSGFENQPSLDQLSSLGFHKNGALKEIRFAQIFGIVHLAVSENPILIRIQGLDNLQSLKNFQIENNPLLISLLPSLSIPTLEHLTFRGNGNIKSLTNTDTGWPELKSLEVANMANLNGLYGAEAYPVLEILVLENLEQFDILSGFGHTPMLRSLTIRRTKLTTLAGLQNLQSLQTVVISNNPRLAQLPPPSAIVELDFVKMIDNENLAAGESSTNYRFLKKSNKRRLRNNASEYEGFFSIYASNVKDIDSYDFFKGDIRKKQFSGPYMVGISFSRESNSRKEVGGYFSLGLQYLHNQGATDFSETHWEAARDFTNSAGTYFQNVRTVPGNDWVNYDIIDLGIRFGASVPIKRLVQVRGTLGLGLMYRLPGEIGLRIRELEYVEKIKGKLKGSVTGNIGLVIPIRRVRFFAEIGIFGPIISDKKIDNETYVFKQDFYSADATSFTTTPLNNSYRIEYQQETFPILFMRGTIGVGYRLSKF